MLYPLFIDFDGKRVLVIGGGAIGTKRAKTLIDSGAEVTVLSKTFTDELKASGAKLVAGDARQTLPDLNDFFLVVVATDDSGVNEACGAEARATGILFNRVDEAGAGDVIFPMTSKVAGHTLAYTTAGENPKLLAKIKKLIEHESESH